MRRRGGDRTHLPVRAEINVTSLVDVAFTLLVIFIITAPVLQGGIQVNVPKGDAGYIEGSDELLIVSIDENNTIFIGDLPVSRDEAPSVLRQLIQANDIRAVYLQGDSLALYGPVFEMIDAAISEEGVGLWLIAETVIR